MKKVLFFSPYMGYTGSEKMIYYITNYANAFRSVVLSGEKGLIIKEKKLVCPSYCHLESSVWGYRVNKLFRLITGLRLSDIQINWIVKKHKIELIVVNTLIAQKIISFLQKKNIPFVLYCHELTPMYELIHEDEYAFLVRSAEAVIGCSEEVAESFRKIGVNKVFVFKECIDVNEIEKYESKEIVDLKKKYKYVFVMSGQMAYHKGFGLIDKVGKFLQRYNAALIWLGADKHSGLSFYIKEIIRKEKLDNVILAGLRQNGDYYSFIKTADAFLLLSLIDPYPLVMLEAAYFQKPIFAFDSGGVREFVLPGMGRVVPNHDLNELFRTIDDFITGKLHIDKELLRQRALEHDIKANIHKFENIIEQIF